MHEKIKIKTTDDGKYIVAVHQKPKESKPGEVMMDPEPMHYVANDMKEVHDLIDEHLSGKEKSDGEKYDKGWKK